MLSSTTLLNVLRRSCSAVTSHTVLNAGWLPEPAAASGQVPPVFVLLIFTGLQHQHLFYLSTWCFSLQVRAARLGGVRQASGSVSLDFIIRDRLVSWESLGIWDNRIEDPIVLPSSVINGTPIPQVSVKLHISAHTCEGSVGYGPPLCLFSHRWICPWWAAPQFWVSGNRTRTVFVSPGSRTTCCTLLSLTVTAVHMLQTSATPSWRSSSGWLFLTSWSHQTLWYWNYWQVVKVLLLKLWVS